MKVINKVLVALLLVLIAVIVSGVYGIIHDQFTYSLSPEYYTKFKFYQFGFGYLYEVSGEPTRSIVSYVGWLATWWVGLILGIILSGIGFLHQTAKKMFVVTIKAIGINLMIVIVMGLIGLGIGYLFGNIEGFENRPYQISEVVEKRDFVAVGWMHNFGYLGGVIGLIAGVIFSLKKKEI